MGHEPLPAIRRLRVTTPQHLYGPEPAKGRKRTGGLPASLGLRPGSPYLAIAADRAALTSDGEVGARDPGGDLSGWQDLTWVRRDSGERVTVTLDPEVLPDRGIFHAQRLADQASTWSARPRTEPIDRVHVDERNVLRVGRTSPVLDAALEGLGDVAAHRVAYGAPQWLELVQEEARRLGPQAFSERTGASLRAAKRASAGQPISAANVARALRALDQLDARRCACGCGEMVVGRSDSAWD